MRLNCQFIYIFRILLFQGICVKNWIYGIALINQCFDKLAKQIQQNFYFEIDSCAHEQHWNYQKYLIQFSHFSSTTKSFLSGFIEILSF